jgi:hypothetical protein
MFLQQNFSIKKTAIARSGAIGGEAEANPEIPHFARNKFRISFIFYMHRPPQAQP